MALRPREMKRLIAENAELKAQIANVKPSAVSEENKELKAANEEGQKDFSKLQAQIEALKKGASPVASSVYKAIIAENEQLKAENDPLAISKNQALHKENEALTSANAALRVDIASLNKKLTEAAKQLKEKLKGEKPAQKSNKRN